MAVELDKETIGYLERLMKRGGHDGETARKVLIEVGVYKYSDDQPRDDDGRFASGSGSGSTGIVSRAAKIARDRIGGAPNRADALGMAKYHRGEAAKAMAARNETGYKDVAGNLNALAKAHLDAEKTWRKVADYSNKNVEADASKAVNQTLAAVNHYGNADLPK